MRCQSNDCSLVRSVSGLGTRISFGYFSEMKARTSSRKDASWGDSASSILSALPLLTEGADFQLEGPSAPRLLVELPVGRRDRGRWHQQIRIVERTGPERFQAPLADPLGVDAGIDNQVGDMDILRAQLTCHRLRHSAQSEFGAGKGSIAAAAAQRSGRTREEDVALAARQHQPGRLAPRKEAGVAGHLPSLAENALGRFEDREVDVGANVEDADIQGRVLVGVVQEGDDLLLLARVERTCVNLAAGGLDLLDQRRQLVAVAAAGEDSKALGSKLLGNLAADEIARADHGDGCISLFQGTSPG